MYQHVAEGTQWTKDHLDVQLCEDPSHCLRETIESSIMSESPSHSGPFKHSFDIIIIQLR